MSIILVVLSNNLDFQSIFLQWVLPVGATMEADLEELNGLGPAACMAPIGGMITSTGFIYPSDVLELPEYQKKGWRRVYE